jgi:hypothetical protein
LNIALFLQGETNIKIRRLIMMLQYLDTIIAFTVIMLGISLLITVLTQMISALLGYRGVNLLWGLKKLLGTIEPQLKDKADTLARNILEKSIISDSIFSRFKNISGIGTVTKRWRLASAITAEELASCLKHLAETMETSDKPTADLITTLLNEPNPQAMRKVDMIQKVLSGLNSNCTVQLDKAMQQLGATVQSSIGKLEAGFDAVMKRASQRFTMQMRIWTIIFAILISFAARIDSVDLIHQLWTDPVQRNNLISQKEMILEEASAILPDETGATQSATSGVSPKILTDALERLKKEEKTFTAGLPAAPQFKNMNEAVEWLRANLKSDKTTCENLTNKYQVMAMEELKKHADTIKQGLAKGNFRLQIPTSWKALKTFYAGLHIWGILITAAFLSLGAPFWFSALKTLSNLRPSAVSATKETPGSAQS